MKGKALAAIVVLVACAHEETPLLVMGVLVPPTPNASTCVFPADANGPFLGVGLVDTTLTSGYTAVLLIGNETIVKAGHGVDLEDGDIVDTASVVDFEADGTTELDRFTTDASGFVKSASGGSLGLATIAVDLVSPHALATVTGNRILARIHVDGRTQGGAPVTSGDLVFPVDVCAGCLVGCPSPGACVVGQDQPVCQ